MPTGGREERELLRRGRNWELAKVSSGFRLQPEDGSDWLQSVLIGSRLEQLQIQQQPNQNFQSGWQFGKMHCAVVSILMTVLLLTLLDVWMAYLDSGFNSSEPRSRDMRNLTTENRNLTKES